MRRKLLIILSILLFIFFGDINYVNAASACSKEAVEELGKIVFMEFGGDFASDPKDNMFVKLNVASIVLNNAVKVSGNGWKEKIYNLSDRQYQSHSTYRNSSYDSLLSSKGGDAYKGEIAYISALVLSGKYNLPSNMVGQASCRCLYGGSAKVCAGVDTDLSKYDCPASAAGWGKEWTHVEAIPGIFDVYFGYSASDNGLSSVNVFNDEVTDSSVQYYRALANSLKKSSYSDYTTDNVCTKVSSIIIDNDKVNNDKNEIDDNKTCTGRECDSEGINSKPNNDKNEVQDNSLKKDSGFGDVCTRTEILRVIYFFMMMLDIVKILIPLVLIVMGTIDFARGVSGGDEESQKKRIKVFSNRIIASVVIFGFPIVVKILIIALGDLTDGVNFTDCLHNANTNCISALDIESQEDIEKYCDKNSWDYVVKRENNDHVSSEDDHLSQNNKYNYITYIVDSRTVEMCKTITLNSNENCTVAEVGMGYSWLNQDSTKNKIDNIVTSHPNSYIVVNMGTNSSLTSDDGKKYAKLYNEFATRYPNSKVVAVSVTQVDSVKAKENGLYSGISINNDSVKTFNKGLKSNLNSNVIYCDVYSKMQNYNYNATDGVHYNGDTYKFIYNEIQKCLK